MMRKLQSSPVLARVVPFALFAALTMLQGRFGDNSQYWIYLLKTLLGGWILWQLKPALPEVSWKVSWEAVAVGVAVFLAWVGLDGRYPLLAARPGTFDPIRSYGAGGFAMAFIAVRIAGSTLVVPPLEEVFYRSFLYRYMIRPNFLDVPLSCFSPVSFLVVALIFGGSHFEWLPGILCGMAYQGLVCRKNRLGDAVTAHAVTNFLLGLWVVFRHAYLFW